MHNIQTLQEYVAYCPSCGQKLTFEKSDSLEEMDGNCTCGKKWSFLFQLDKSGTFGVISFQCNNQDRIF